MKKNLKAVVFLALIRPAFVQALPVSARLDRAAEFSQAAAGAGSLEQARAISFNALDSGLSSGAPAVDASDASMKKSPALSAPQARPSTAEVPSPASSGRRDNPYGYKSGTGFAIAGLLSPVVGAIAGALLGGVAGAVAGVLIGAGVGLVLLVIALGRALRRIFNP